MTMLAFHARRDAVEVVTDSLAYSDTMTAVSDPGDPKFLLLPKLGAAVLSGGSDWFRAAWWPAAEQLAGRVESFDGFVAAADRLLPALTGRLREVCDPRIVGQVTGKATVLAVGWSPSRRRFVGAGWHTTSGMSRVGLDDFYVQPTPGGCRPGPVEAAYVRNVLAAEGDKVGLVELDDWLRQPPPRPPTSKAGWVRLACQVRETRALPVEAWKTPVGGTVWWARVSRDGVDVDAVHRFDDSGAEFAQLVAGTLHPVSQAAPCVCGSGRRYVDCHLAGARREPCPCGSRKVFVRCCSIDNTGGVEPSMVATPAELVELGVGLVDEFAGRVEAVGVVG